MKGFQSIIHSCSKFTSYDRAKIMLYQAIRRRTYCLRVKTNLLLRYSYKKSSEADFKSLCHGKGPTVILGTVKGNYWRYEGFTQANWTTQAHIFTMIQHSFSACQIRYTLLSIKDTHFIANQLARNLVRIPHFGFCSPFNEGSNDSCPNDHAKSYSTPKSEGFNSMLT